MNFKAQKLLFLLLLIVFINVAYAQDDLKRDLNYYLPQIEYDQSITTPEEFLGYQIGEWHITHDQLYFYLKNLATESPRVKLVEYARSHEDRPLVYCIITNEANHDNINDIKAAQQKLCKSDQGSQVDIENTPMVIYQGYTIHGNESSGANAAPLVAYYLTAGQGDHVDSLLSEMVILLDPSYNPDGQQRFSSWVNSNKGVHTIADVHSRELNEPWPRGRTNHYWFDLNRDWLLLTHPESQGRVKTFHEWKPTVLTDHHEMGSNNTFFFQPGIPSRTNPNTPQKNQDLTGKIGEFHAKALDSIGSLYYTKESFDDFYYGKGSTYPDINGAIGILFEQASSRGHKQSTVNGDLDFPFTIRNQVVTSLSTQDASLAIKNDLLSYKRDFYKNAASERSSDAIKGYVIKSRDDAKLDAFIDKLSQHQIDVFSLKSDVNAGSSSYPSDGNSYIIPTDQQQSKLIKAMFEKVTSFNDSLFYDVSAWTFPAAFDLQYDALKSGQLRSGMIGDRVSGHAYNKVFNNPSEGEVPYAYLMNWENTMAASASYNLLREGLNLKVLTKDVMHPEYDQLFEAGTVIIPTTQKNMSTSEVISMISDQVSQYGIKVYPVSTGLNTKGPMLGSPSQRPLNTPTIALVVGSGVNAYDAGHIWHHLDHTMSMPVTLLNVEDIGAASLQSYNTLIMADGRYTSLSEDQLHHLTHWVKSGGKIMAFKRAIDWLNAKKLIQISRSKSESKGKTMQLPYSKSSSTWGARRIGGSIFNTQVDLSHPLFYGYEDDQVAFMKRGTTFYDPIANPYATPARYTDNPLVSGYIHKSQIKMLANSAAVTVFGQGRGKIICFSDNPLFRGYWWGGFRVFNNAILFGDILSTGTTGDDAHGHGHMHE